MTLGIPSAQFVTALSRQLSTNHMSQGAQRRQEDWEEEEEEQEEEGVRFCALCVSTRSRRMQLNDTLQTAQEAATIMAGVRGTEPPARDLPTHAALL